MYYIAFKLARQFASRGQPSKVGTKYPSYLSNKDCDLAQSKDTSTESVFCAEIEDHWNQQPCREHNVGISIDIHYPLVRAG